jgi:hypothetical protein
MNMLMINDQDLNQDPEYRMRVVYQYEPFFQRSTINPDGTMDHQTIWAIPADTDLATALALRWLDEIWFQEVG